MELRISGIFSRYWGKNGSREGMELRISGIFSRYWGKNGSREGNEEGVLLWRGLR